MSVWRTNIILINNNIFKFFFSNFNQIFRYDGRLYLNNLEEFDKQKHRESRALQGEDLSAEQLEEEMCDEERYRDMYADIKKTEGLKLLRLIIKKIFLEEELKKRGKGAEINFSYDTESLSKKLIANYESSSSEEDIDEPYSVPDGLKLPVGISLVSY